MLNILLIALVPTSFAKIVIFHKVKYKVPRLLSQRSKTINWSYYFQNFIYLGSHNVSGDIIAFDLMEKNNQVAKDLYQLAKKRKISDKKGLFTQLYNADIEIFNYIGNSFISFNLIKEKHDKDEVAYLEMFKGGKGRQLILDSHAKKYEIKKSSPEEYLNFNKFVSEPVYPASLGISEIRFKVLESITIIFGCPKFWKYITDDMVIDVVRNHKNGEVVIDELLKKACVFSIKNDEKFIEIGEDLTSYCSKKRVPALDSNISVGILKIFYSDLKNSQRKRQELDSKIFSGAIDSTFNTIFDSPSRYQNTPKSSDNLFEMLEVDDKLLDLSIKIQRDKNTLKSPENIFKIVETKNKPLNLSTKSRTDQKTKANINPDVNSEKSILSTSSTRLSPILKIYKEPNWNSAMQTFAALSKKNLKKLKSIPVKDIDSSPKYDDNTVFQQKISKSKLSSERPITVPPTSSNFYNSNTWKNFDANSLTQGFINPSKAVTKDNNTLKRKITSKKNESEQGETISKKAKIIKLHELSFDSTSSQSGSTSLMSFLPGGSYST